MGMVRIFGRMKDNILEIGIKTRCTEKEFLLGQTGKNMKEITKTIKKKDLGFFIGLMGKYIEENGLMGNNMEKGYIDFPMEKNGRVFGNMEKKSNGSTNLIKS